jgi:hypothetical protein
MYTTQVIKPYNDLHLYIVVMYIITAKVENKKMNEYNNIDRWV